MRALLLSALVFALLPAVATAQALLAEGSTPGQSIQIKDLRRDAAGKLMLRMTLINDSERGVSGVMLREQPSDNGEKPSGVKLVDDATGKEYLPMRREDGECVCGVMPNTGKGERANLWVMFAAVPGALNKATVQVRSFEPVADVPIQGPARTTLTAEGGNPGQSIQVRDLRRDANGAVTVRFTFVNDSARGMSGVMLREKRSDSGRKPSGVRLVDEATETAYLPERGADGECVCSEMPNTGRGERANLWVKFQGVPATLRKARVEVKTFEPVANVPITEP